MIKTPNIYMYDIEKPKDCENCPCKVTTSWHGWSNRKQKCYCILDPNKQEYEFSCNDTVKMPCHIKSLDNFVKDMFGKEE